MAARPDPALGRLLRVIDLQLGDLARPLARLLAGQVRASAAGALPDRRLPGLLGRLRAGVARLFGDGPDAVLDGQGRPAVPVARLLDQALGAAARLGAAPVLRTLAGRLRDQPALLAALRAPALPLRPAPLQPPPWQWIGPDGLRLSDRLWRAGRETERQVAALLQAHLARGTPVAEVARDLEQFLTIAGRRTGGPGGEQGLYAARRLAHTELRRAYGLGLLEAVRLSPLAAGVRWQLAAGHPAPDVCDRHAGLDAYGLGPGGYPPEAAPPFPAHPFCRCRLVPIDREGLAVALGQPPAWPLTSDGIAALVLDREWPA